MLRSEDADEHGRLPCDVCGGTGSLSMIAGAGVIEGGACSRCGGTGVVYVARRELKWPPHTTPSLSHAMGTMCFQIIGVAQLLRKRGENIPKGAEHEQAAVMFHLIRIALQHPEIEPYKAAVSEWLGGLAELPKSDF